MIKQILTGCASAILYAIIIIAVLGVLSPWYGMINIMLGYVPIQ